MKHIAYIIIAIAFSCCGRKATVEPMLVEPVKVEPVKVEPVKVEPVADGIHMESSILPTISIWEAAREGDIEAVRANLQDGVSLNEPDMSDSLHRTPLHCAVESGHKAVVELLLSEGAAINAKRIDGLMALDIVLKNDPEIGDEDRVIRKEIAAILVRNGATAARHK